MAKAKTVYICKSCGYKAVKWVGQCPSCKEWNTMKEAVEAPVSPAKVSGGGYTTSKPIKIKDVKDKKDDRILTGDAEIDRMFGGGIVKDSVSILSAPPGAGKSTFSMLLSGKLSKLGYCVLYASGEESDTQIKNRANRILKPDMMDNLYLITDKYRRMETVLEAIKDVNPDFIILDSIQTFTIDRCLPSRAGSPTQVVECANELVTVCKDPVRPRASIIIGQMVKNDELAGPRQLEHLVDSVFYLDGDPYEELRVCTSSKNRFGELETVFFNINEGMESVPNPADYLLTKRAPGVSVSGSAITIIKEGTRPIAIEVESLVSKSFTPYPSRLSEGMKKDQLNIIISILEQKCKLNFFDRNVAVKSVGNIRLQETSTSLAIAMSTVSSLKHKPLPADTVFVGEVGLTGELKKAQGLESKIKEAERMGFKEIVIPNQEIKGKYTIKIVKMSEIKDVVSKYLT